MRFFKVGIWLFYLQANSKIPKSELSFGTILHKHNVSLLYVPMDDSMVVQVSDSLKHLEHDFGNLRLGCICLFFHPVVCEVTLIAPLGDNVEILFIFEDLEEFQQIRVV